LIDLEGRVQAVLVPASPQDEGETAGVGWYDSGIGFGIPLEDINAVLPRLKQGKDLKKGLLGVNMKGTDQYAVPPVIDSVAPGSAAEKAGIKSGDTIIAIDDKPVGSQAQLKHQLGLRYEGDTVTVKVKRDKEEKVFPGVVLSSQVAAYRQAFLGILPLRDDATPGVEIRYVYPKSPAETAGLKVGDRILKIGQGSTPLRAVEGRDQLLSLFETAIPGLEIKLEVKRKAGDKTETVTAKLAEAPESVPDRLPEVSTAKKAKKAPAAKKDDKKEEKKEDEKKEDDEKKDETGLVKRTTAAADHTYYLYIPSNYDPNIAHALVLWLHPTNKNKEKDIDTLTWFWSTYCEDNHVIMLCPISENANGWTPSEGEFINEAVKSVLDAYTIDRKRVVTHGMGVGGQMAFYLGFQNRSLVRGVATTGATLTSNPKEKVGNQPLAFFLAVGGKDPLKDAVKDSQTKLSDFKYSVIYREIAERGHEYLNLDALEELIRWIDSLDRI
jgi:serine protease Do